jgi:hypothetical protein
MHYHFTNVQDNVWVGDFQSCNLHLNEFDLSIHLWRETNRHEGHLCNRIKNNGYKGLVVYWREGEPLSKLSVPFSSIMNYARQPGKLLVHCAGGICRSTTIATACKIARGKSRFQAISDVYQGTWTGYRQAPEFYHHVFNEMFNWFDSYQSCLTLL